MAPLLPPGKTLVKLRDMDAAAVTSLAKELETNATVTSLNLHGNELGGAITDDIAVFTKLTELALCDMELHGAWDGCSNSSRDRARSSRY